MGVAVCVGVRIEEMLCYRSWCSDIKKERKKERKEGRMELPLVNR